MKGVNRIRSLVRGESYTLTLHVLHKLQRLDLSILDLEGIVLQGRAVERQRDDEHRGWKYLFEGRVRGDAFAVVVRCQRRDMLIFVTIYAL
jgi:TolB-like protein